MSTLNYDPHAGALYKGKEINPREDHFYDKLFIQARARRNWQMVCLVLFVMLAGMLAAYVRLSNRVYVEPYVVLVDEKEGLIRNVGELSHVKYVPSDKMIFSVLGQHIKDTRSVPLDYVLFGQNIEKQYLFLTPQAQQKLNAYMQADNVNEYFKNKRSREVKLSTILKMSGNSYQARWEEVSYAENGTVEKKEKFSGIFTFEIKESTDEKTLMVNPLGIMIKDFSYNHEL
ncbi:MAG: type IV secretion system protein [Fusobacteriaceae bacterium]|jgi:type IV secretion system protein VirB5|nr:type IV secretion system protein [Fusobacteriaceae bacterium]